MKGAQEFIESGILELYVLGETTAVETAEVESMAAAYPAVKQEIYQIEQMLEEHAFANAIEPHHTIKPLMMASIDYNMRLQAGEKPEVAPLLHQGSSVNEYAQWLNRDDMVMPEENDNIFLKIISYTPEALTAIVWVKDRSEAEVHDDEYERFLVVEGSCRVTVENEDFMLAPGSYFGVPLHKPHSVKVTSATPCKVIVQRVAVGSQA